MISKDKDMLDEQIQFKDIKSPKIQSNISKNKSKSKNWNIFRSPQQKDLFDFLEHQNDSIQIDIDKVQFKTQQRVKNDHIIEQQDEQSSWKSQLAFASQKNQQNQKINSFMIKNSKQQQQESYGTMKSQKQLRSILKNDNILKKQLFLKCQDPEVQQKQKINIKKTLNDSLSNLFLKELTYQRPKQGKRLFQNYINFQDLPHHQTISQHQFMRTESYKDKNSSEFTILKTLNDIKSIDKENLQINKMIYELLKSKSQFNRTITENQMSSKTKRTLKRKSTGSNVKSQSKCKTNHKVSIEYQHNLSTQSNISKKTFFIPSQNYHKSKSKSKLSLLTHNHNLTNQTNNNIFNKTSIQTSKKYSNKQKENSKLTLNTINQSANTATMKKLKKNDVLMLNKLQDKIHQKLHEIDKIKSSLNGLIVKKNTISLKLNNNNTSKKKSNSVCQLPR